MTRIEIERSGHSIPLYDIKTQDRIWVIDGNEYVTRNIFPNVPMNLNGRTINCARTIDILENHG